MLLGAFICSTNSTLWQNIALANICWSRGQSAISDKTMPARAQRKAQSLAKTFLEAGPRRGQSQINYFPKSHGAKRNLTCRRQLRTGTKGNQRICKITFFRWHDHDFSLARARLFANPLGKITIFRWHDHDFSLIQLARSRFFANPLGKITIFR